MFRKILLPLDLSDRHERAVDIAAGLAAPTGAEVVLLHVVQLIHGLAPDDEPQFYRRLEKKADEALARCVDRLEMKGTPARAVVLIGDRVPEVLRFAKESGVDLIILTSHAVDPTRPGAEWGTLSYLIGITAQCPVLLVK